MQKQEDAPRNVKVQKVFKPDYDAAVKSIQDGTHNPLYSARIIANKLKAEGIAKHKEECIEIFNEVIECSNTATQVEYLNSVGSKAPDGEEWTLEEFALEAIARTSTKTGANKVKYLDGIMSYKPNLDHAPFALSRSTYKRPDYLSEEEDW